ncbi:Dabb family protein [Vallitalea pronyensis]|uniref:Dabb family protein n=1 Tax=Vallitalea pronyensis TaxID=1348613 RepID=A0A8J8SIZ4_9FIRM|nr:Dabb family protein [Vallitalea pronyensis]QUI25435.1 Dabb family protein [Vallitalea pronyensis]
MKVNKPIIHSAAFILKHDKGSDEEAAFMVKAWDMLACIPGVKDFRILEIINDSNPYDYELEMRFDNEEQLEAYKAHPNHWDQVNKKGFVEEVWVKEVKDFLEKDTVVIRK